MMQDVERVAKAIKTVWDDWHIAEAERSDAFDYEPGPWEDWIPEATAAISAMTPDTASEDVLLGVTWHDKPKPAPEELDRRVKLAMAILCDGQLGDGAPDTAEITSLRAELAEARKALRLIQSAAQQSGNWPPQRRDAALEGIEKVAIRALMSQKPPIL